jgi:phosphoesterase RecJ-like protein
MTRVDDAAFHVAARQIERCRRPLLLSHTKPDGDAVGALQAMNRMLAGRGARPVTVVFDPLPERYTFLTEPAPPLRFDAALWERQSDGMDGVLVLDTCSYSQLEPIAAWLRATRLPKIVVDHHATRDDLGALELIDETAAATCLLLDEWRRAAGWPLTPAIAEALFVGVAADTGWFRHANTDARALQSAVDLTAAGADPHSIFERLFHRESQARFRLRAAATGRVELSAGARLAVLTLPASLFADCGATLADTEDLVNEPLRIASVVVSAVLVEQGDGVIRVGLRSKEPVAADAPDIDVSAIAASLGGGGHRRAAGARMTGTLDGAAAALTGRLETLLPP